MEIDQLAKKAEEVIKLAELMEGMNTKNDERITQGNLKVAIMAGIKDGYNIGLRKQEADVNELFSTE